MKHLRHGLAGLVFAAAIALPASPVVAAETASPSKGRVDKQMFLDLLPSEDPIRVEVTIPKSLIDVFCASLEPELKEIACGLEGIEALIVELNPKLHGPIVDLVNKVDRDLQQGGWERIVLVREDDEQVRVLIYNAEQAIRGLVVMVVDNEEMVFVNVVGLIDLGAMQQLASKWNVPGFDHIKGDLERDANDEKDKKKNE